MIYSFCEIPHQLGTRMKYLVWKPLPIKCILKTLRESLKRTISTSGGLGPLQTVLKLDTG